MKKNVNYKINLKKKNDTQLQAKLPIYGSEAIITENL